MNVFTSFIIDERAAACVKSESFNAAVFIRSSFCSGSCGLVITCMVCEATMHVCIHLIIVLGLNTHSMDSYLLDIKCGLCVYVLVSALKLTYVSRSILSFIS